MAGARTIVEAARELPVAAEAEVLVIGGGPGGLLAAVAAARCGADVLLVERYGFLGGMATAGLMTSFNGFRNEHPPDHVQTVRGLAQELVDRLREAGGACGCTAHGNFGPLQPGVCPYAVSFDPEVFKRVALELVRDAGVKLRLHTTFSTALTEGRCVTHAVVESKSGREALGGRLFIDASGDGDLCARAGARFELVAKSNERMMPLTLMYRVAGLPEPGPEERRLWVNGVTTQWGPAARETDGSEVGDLTRAEVEARLALETHLARLQERFPDAKLVESATTIGVRETRRVLGLYTITEEDVLTGRPQPDSIAVSSNPVPGYYGERRFLAHLGFEIPYRCLVPTDLDNVLLAGRCISACQPAFQSARSMAPAMAIAQASGTAAALCLQGSCRPAELDVTALQARLEADGAVVRVPVAERGAAQGTGRSR